MRTAQNPIQATIKRSLLWQYLKFQARRAKISGHELERVGDYLFSRFRLQTFPACSEMQQPADFFPGLSLTPVYCADQFQWVQRLEENATGIRDEFLSLKARGAFVPHPQKLAQTGDWNTYYLYSNGWRYDRHCEECPTTAGTVATLPGAGIAGQAYFSVMSAGTHVRPHYGPTNTRIRCHLGLVVPRTSVLRIGKDRVCWQEGRCTIFDDSVEHEVWNPDSERAVLIVDVWHPELTAAERWALTQIAKISERNRNYRHDIQGVAPTRFDELVVS